MTTAIFGNYGVKNLGDDLILQGLVEEEVLLGKAPLAFLARPGVARSGSLPRSGHLSPAIPEIVIFCGNPNGLSFRPSFVIPRESAAADESRNPFSSYSFFPSGIRSWFKYLFSSSYRTQVQEAFEALKSCDRIILGGGGLLVDRRFKAVLLWWQQLRWIRKTGKPFEFLGVSFELNRWWTKRLFLPFLKSASRITVRDSASLGFLASFGVRSELVDDYAHVTLSSRAKLSLMSFRPTLQSDAGEWPARRGGRNPFITKRKICLALCQWGLKNHHQRSLRTFVEKRRSEGFEIIGLAFQTEGDDDRKILNRLDPNLPVVFEPTAVLQELSESTLLIGVRYHSLLLALRMNVPVIALGYQGKISALMKDQGVEKQTVQLSKLNAERLEEMFQNVLR